MIPGAHDPDGTAVLMAGSGDALTFGELDAAANRFHHLLRSWGLEAGAHIAWCLPNCLAFFEVAWGAHYAGTLYTAISTRLGVDELAYIAADCGARVLVLPGGDHERATAVRAATPDVEHHVMVGAGAPGWQSYEQLVTGQPATPVDEERVGGKDMLYSSGTTGKPKGILPTPAATPLDETPVVVTSVLEGMFGVGPADVYLSPAPLYHAAPLRFCMSMHQLGARVVAMERFDPGRFLALVAEHGVTVSQLVPTMFVRLLRLDDRARAGADVSTLRLVIHAAAPCPPDVKREMLEWWGPIIHEYYASTEACGLTWVRPEEWAERPGTVGRALIGTPHIMGEDGIEVAAGQTGAVYFSDGPVFAYHNDPEKTAANTNEHGWQTFGDIGHLDEDGYLFLTDRASHMIISGGVNVYPQEAEDALQAHPAVLDAAVFGIPDPDWGEVAHAVVQPMEMPADAAALERELLDHLHGRLAKLKCPRAIDFRASLPRHETGKLYKRLLKDEYAARSGA